MAQPLIIGITGNIGSGKSSFCQHLKEKGFTVVSADTLAQQQLDLPDSRKQIIRRWGKDVVKQGKADRSQIAGIVFHDPRELDFLTRLIHPKTLVAMQQIVDEFAGDYLFFEVPLLFEAGLQQCFDFLVLVQAKRELRLQRLLKQHRADRAALEARFNSQIADEEKAPLCDLVIDNDSGLEALKTKASKFIASLPSLKSREKLPFST